MKRVVLTMSALALAAGCVEAREVPNLIPQSKVSYGPRVYLVDDTRDFRNNSGHCTRLATVATTTTATVTATDGKSEPLNRGLAHNCFIEVQPRELMVDVHEVTNELYQLCIDSGACLKPDPSKGSKGQVCSNEGNFDQCPVVELTLDSAELFCRWTGRRLPTGIEHIIMRQGNSTPSNPETLSIFPLAGGMAPDGCDDAIVSALGGCNRPAPVINPDGSPRGGATGDSVTASEGDPILDLVGNVTEWSSDTFAKERGNANDLPWFCTAALPEPTTPGQPECPGNSRCIYGQYAPENGDLGIHPICITNDNGAFNGELGSLFGGSYRDSTAGSERLGTFARRVENNPQDPQDTNNSLEYGFRCVGNVTEEQAARANGAVYPIQLNRL